MSTIAGFYIFRHRSFCRPGLWLANLTFAVEYAGAGHVHAHCVVDDFGTLQIVGLSALTATGDAS